MKIRHKHRPDLTGPCPKCKGQLAVFTLENEPGLVCDGDDVICLNPTCSAVGTLCGAPSDGIRVIWETGEDEPTTSAHYCRNEFEDIEEWKIWFNTGEQDALTNAIEIMERVVALTGRESDHAKIRKPFLEYAFNKMNERFPNWLEESIPF